MSQKPRISEIEHIADPENPAEVGVFIFAGHGNPENIGAIPRFEFVKTMEKTFPSLDVHFYVDFNICWYAKGLDGITSNIDETVEYLRTKKHKKNIFLGNSAGGYAAILFGSLLEVDRVIAFHPQSNLTTIPGEASKHRHVDRKYMKLDQYINDITDYRIYGCDKGGLDHPNDQVHHSRQLDFLTDLGKPNISRFLLKEMLKKIRDSGELTKILEESFKI